MTAYLFDDRNIAWQPFGDIEHLHYVILDVDNDRKIIDVLFKLAANQQIVLHRHKALNKTFVIQGEHKLYTPDGALKEVRPTGSYTNSLPSEEPHREGGGEIDAIVFFSIRGDGLLYEILDDEQKILATISFDDLKELYFSAGKRS